MSKIIAVLLGIVTTVVIVGFLVAIFLYLGWNYGVSPVLGLKEITLVQAFFLQMAANALFKGGSATISK